MPNINLTVRDEKSLDPELIAVLKKVHNKNDIYRLYDEYGQDTVVDAMLLTRDDCHPESLWNLFRMEDYEELTKEAFEYAVVPDIVKLFLNRKEKPKQKKLTLDDVILEE